MKTSNVRGVEQAHVEEKGPILARAIPVIPDADIYKSIIDSSVSSNTNTELETEIPTTRQEWMDFFARAMAKEIKLVNSEKNEQFILPVFPKMSNDKKYKNLTALKKSKIEYIDDFIDDSNVIFMETLNVLYNGNPYKNLNKNSKFDIFKKYEDLPTTLLLYYRQLPGLIPIYSAHIFLLARPKKKDLYFVSIYKSILETDRTLTTRILKDIEEYARLSGYTAIFTNPLPGPMEDKLLDYGFEIKPRETTEDFVLTLEQPNCMGGLCFWKGGKRTRRKQNKNKLHSKIRTCKIKK